MISSEWALSDDLAILQAEMINRLDLLFQKRRPNDSVLQKQFIHELLVSFHPGYGFHDMRLYAAVEALCDVVDLSLIHI